jgi:hypothetical protein
MMKATEELGRAFRNNEIADIIARIKKFETDWNRWRQNTSTADIG